MNRVLIVLLTAVLALTLPVQAIAGSAPARQLSGPDLVSMTRDLDGAAVTFEGEVVSEPLAGGEGHRWLNVLSDGVAIGVWMPVEMAQQVEQFGRWSYTGDKVRVTGVLHEACDAHGGDLDVHAQEMIVLTAGHTRTHPIQYWKGAAGVAGLALAYGIVRRTWRREEQPE